MQTLEQSSCIHVQKSLARMKSVRRDMEAGFKNESQRKVSLLRLSSAYDAIKTAVNNAVFARIKDEDESQHDRYWDLSMPLDLHRVRDKHHSYAIEICPSIGAYLQAIRDMGVARDEIRLAALLPKPVDARCEQRGHCQICGKLHPVAAGELAKHAYRDKSGYFKGACPGSARPPMEKKRDLADHWIKAWNDEAKMDEIQAQAFDAAKAAPDLAPSGPAKNAPMVPYAEAPAYFQAQARALAALERRNHARAVEALAFQINMLVGIYHGRALLKVLR